MNYAYSWIQFLKNLISDVQSLDQERAEYDHAQRCEDVVADIADFNGREGRTSGAAHAVEWPGGYATSVDEYGDGYSTHPISVHELGDITDAEIDACLSVLNEERV